MVRPYQKENNKQQMKIENGKIQLCATKVLDIADLHKSAGAKVVSWMSHGGNNQRWKFDYTDQEAPKKTPNYFFIRSLLNDMVLNIEDGSKEPGVRVLMEYKNEEGRLKLSWFMLVL